MSPARWRRRSSRQFTKLTELAAPYIAEFDRLFAEHYPAEFAKATLCITIRPGGIHPLFREKVRRDAALHIAARKAFMLANSSTFVTETMTEATKRTTDNSEVHEMLDRLAVPNRATPTLEPPGAAIGVLRSLLPHPEEWGFAGYDGAGSPLLPVQGTKPKASRRPRTRSKTNERPAPSWSYDCSTAAGTPARPRS